MEDETSTAEVIRLASGKTGRANTKARWENVITMWQQGKTLVEIGRWIGKSESTVRHLLKRAARERQKQPGFVWPVVAGKKVCDIPHPMPNGRRTGYDEDPRQWHHARAEALTPASKTMYCPVCKRGYPLGKTLSEIFEDVYADDIDPFP